IQDSLPELKYVVCRGERPDVDLGEEIQLISFDDLRSPDSSALEDMNRPSDVAVFVYTSGTTGPSKGCILSHNNMVNLARQVIESDDRREGDVVWTCLPFFHFNAQATTVISSTLIRGTAWVSPRFSVSRFWQDIECSGAVVASLLGAMIPLIGQAEDTKAMKRCYGQLRTVAGAPFPAEMQDVFRDRFGVQRAGSNVYGLTEATCLTLLPKGVRPKPGSSGMVAPDFDVRIFDDNDNELPTGEVGEVVCRPRRPHVMFEGYHNRPDATAAIMRNMWLHTGDIGKFDDDGFFFFVDRKKDYLRRRGENISSYEIESLFQQHPDISEVAAHAVYSELGEDDLKITVVREPTADLTEGALCEWCLDRLPYFAVPRYIEFRSELPKNPLGKIEKFRLRDDGCTAATWDREKSGLTIEKR
ncbi:MAG: AMP-binding protein, partial [Pseudomonadales bacterium]